MCQRCVLDIDSCLHLFVTLSQCASRVILFVILVAHCCPCLSVGLSRSVMFFFFSYLVYMLVLICLVLCLYRVFWLFLFVCLFVCLFLLLILFSSVVCLFVCPCFNLFFLRLFLLFCLSLLGVCSYVCVSIYFQFFFYLLFLLCHCRLSIFVVNFSPYQLHVLARYLSVGETPGGGE